jgi:hypothetical protein
MHICAIALIIDDLCRYACGLNVDVYSEPQSFSWACAQGLDIMMLLHTALLKQLLLITP